MAFEDYFDAKLALDETTNNVVPGAQALVYAITDTSFSSPLPITDLTGSPLATLDAGPNGIYPPFKCPGRTQVLAKSGSVVTPLTSVYGAALALVPDPTSGLNGQILSILNGEWEIRDNEGGASGGNSLEDLPAGITVTRTISGTTWPARGTGRTDIIILWVGGTDGSRPPGALVNDIHWPNAN